MGFDISSIIGGSIGDAFAKIVGVFKVSPEKALEAQTQLETIRLGFEQQLVQQVTAQIEVDKQEASNASIFVAGWRPFIGWICGSGLACQFIIGPRSEERRVGKECRYGWLWATLKKKV